ncbi:MAG: VCBS repeat-containing protein [Planctomycetota bacterium]
MTKIRHLIPFALVAQAATAPLLAAQAADTRFSFEGAPVLHEVAPPLVPGTRPLGRSVVLLDVDGDGVRDVARVMERLDLGVNVGGTIVPYGVFDPFANGLGVGEIAAGDADGDGVQDLFLAATQVAAPNGAALRVLRFDGAGGYALAPSGPQPPIGANASSSLRLAVADLDGDGDDDGVLADLANARMWSATSGVVALPGRPSALALADVDGDGDEDAVLLLRDATGSDVRVHVRANDGAGGFPTVLFHSAPYTDLSALAVVDADGDGRADVVTTTFTAVVGQPHSTDLLVFRGDGTGALRPPVVSHLLDLGIPAWDVEASDLDEDGDQDLVVACETSFTSSGGLLVVAHGDGSGTFANAATLSLRARDVAIDDWTGSGARCVVTAEGQVVPVDGAGLVGGVRPPVSSLVPGAIVRHAAVDWDADGVNDLAVLDAPTGEIRVHLSDGNGGFAGSVLVATGLTALTPGYTHLEAADLDGDAWPDLALFAGDRFAGLRNTNGTGAHPLDLAPFGTCTLLELQGRAVADLDGDGDDDLLATDYYFPRMVVALGDGAGGFDVRCVTLPDVAGEVVAADLTGDGDVDLAFASKTTGDLWVLPGLGNGAFGAGVATDLPASLFRWGAAGGDVDGDGDTDLVFGRSSGLAYLENDGTGTFTQAQLLQDVTSYVDVELVDLDDDGDLDCVGRRGYLGLSTLHCFERTPTGFVRAEAAFEVADSWSHPTYEVDSDLVDMDADGLPDLVVSMVAFASEMQNPVVFPGRTQLRADGRARPGSGFDLEIAFSGGGGRPYLALASALGTRPTLPLGADALPLAYDPLLFDLALGGAAACSWASSGRSTRRAARRRASRCRRRSCRRRRCACTSRRCRSTSSAASRCTRRTRWRGRSGPESRTGSGDRTGEVTGEDPRGPAVGGGSVTRSVAPADFSRGAARVTMRRAPRRRPWERTTANLRRPSASSDSV